MAKKSDSREKILKVSAKVFAEKGYDGARVDEIAKEANVTKSLIYYHFKSKKEVLDELLNNFFDTYKSYLLKILEDYNKYNDEKCIDEMNKFFGKYLKENENIVRIIFVESLKVNNERPLLYRITDILLEIKDLLKDKSDYKKVFLKKMFTNILPKGLFICFAKSWMKEFDISQEELYNDFFRLMMDVNKK